MKKKGGCYEHRFKNSRRVYPRFDRQSNRVITGQIKKQFIHDKQDIISLLKTDNISEGEKNQILRSLIDKIVFNRSDCTVRIFYFI